MHKRDLIWKKIVAVFEWQQSLTLSKTEKEITIITGLAICCARLYAIVLNVFSILILKRPFSLDYIIARTQARIFIECNYYIGSLRKPLTALFNLNEALGCSFE